MADTFTANLHLTLPEIGASDDTWGDKLNDDITALDALFATSGAGTVIVRDSNNDALVSGINLTKAAGNARALRIKSGTSLRWDIGADATAEGGSNAGSLFKVNRYDDSGALLGVPITIARDTGLVTFETTPKVGSNLIWHTGNDTALRTPVGSGMVYFGTAAPTNHLFGFGQVLSQTTYADLYAAIGSTFNTGGEGPGNFRMPDCRDVVLVGKGNMGGASRGLITIANSTVLGGVIGEQTHLLTATEIPPHTHSGATGTAGDHTHNNNNGGTTKVGANGASLNGYAAGGSGTVPNNFTDFFNDHAGDHAHSFTTDGGAVGNAAHANLQPSMCVNIIIRVFP